MDFNRILLEETIAFSDGQESDKATINGMQVLDSQIVGNDIYYTLPENHGLHHGSVVGILIDTLR